MDKGNNRGMRDWLVFIRTAEVGNLTQVARELSITTGAVSKSVSRLEDYLGTMLFTRTPKGMNLTVSGQRALECAYDLTNIFNSLLDDIRNPKREIKGTVRFSAPAIVCEFLANVWADDYTNSHPQVKVLLDARERTDLDRNSPELDDLVLRSGIIECEDLVHRPLSPLKLVLCASPDFLSKHPPIEHPRDLEKHKLLRMHNNGLDQSITLSNADETYTLSEVSYTGISSNNVLSMLNLVIQGRGISIATPGWLASGYISQGQLEIVLPSWFMPELPVWLIWRQRPKQSALFNNFRDYIEHRWNSRPQHLIPTTERGLLQPDFLTKVKKEDGNDEVFP